MIKIISPGFRHTEELHLCKDCGCIFRFDRKDVTNVKSSEYCRETSIINCPYCLVVIEFDWTHFMGNKEYRLQPILAELQKRGISQI